MINHFTFNGTSTAQLGLIVSGVSIFGAGSRKVEKAGIPGRNGDLQIELGGFNNYTVRYTVSITKNFTTTAQQIREWLLESKGYCDLTDTYHPDEIRKACFNSDIEFTTSMLYKYGQASIQFDCLPQRYIIRNTPITTTPTEDTTTGTTVSINTVAAPIKMTLNGNTTQEGTPTPSTPETIHNVSGDNEVNVASFNVWDEISFVSSSRIQSQNYIPVLPNTAYYRKSPNNILVTYYNANKEQLSTGTWGTGLFTTPQNCYFIKFMVDPVYGTTYKHDICINVSNAEKNGTYEPYTRQSYPLYLPVENLLPRRTTRTTNGVTFTVNADGSISTSGTATANIYNALAVLNLPNDTYTMTGSAKGGSTSTYYMYTEPHYRGDTGNGVTFTDSITSCSIFVASGQNMDGKVFKPQIEKGSKANAYTPYGTTPIELNKIGTYQDYIYKNGGKWYVHKETASVDMGTLTYQTDNGGVYFYSSVSGKGRTNFDLLCTCYTVTTSTNTSGMTDFQIKGQTSGSYIFIKDSRYTSPTDLKTALSGETLKYNLATATNTEITDTTLINQLNNIEKAYSYNGTTNILQASNDNGFMLGVVSLHGSTFNSNYKGEPIITVNATGLIYLNGEVMEVLSAPVTINCQTMQCYNGVINMNNEVRVNDFPEIKIGANEVGSSMALTITPNNWRH